VQAQCLPPMSAVPPPLIDEADETARAPSLVEEVRHLVSDGRVLLEAELAYQKSRAVVAGSGAKGIAGWGALALALVYFALMALILGLLLALTPLIGGWGAMFAVTLGILVGAGLSAWIALRRWKRMKALLSDNQAAP
jgi:hypothetical protein